MLKSLKIENLGLVSHAEFEFHNGLTCITGETGSGKTSLIEALKLTLGKKSDFDLIKTGSLKAEVTSVFELDCNHYVYSYLKNHQIQIDCGEPVIITRILSKEGKSKTLVNGQNTSLFVLNEIRPLLCDFVDQDDLLKLHDDFFFHDLLDNLGNSKDALSKYQHSFESVKKIKHKIQELQAKTVSKDFKIKILGEEIEELNAANIKNGEEEESYEKYKKLSQKKESLSSLLKHSELLNQDFIPKLKRLKSDKALLNYHILIEDAYQKICELSMALESEVSDPLFDDDTLIHLEERLKTIYTLKRKYNPLNDDFHTLLKDKKSELDALYKLEDDLIELEKLLKQENIYLEQTAEELEQKRKIFAVQLQNQLVMHLRPLNMPYAELEFRFSDCAFHEKGSHMIELFIRANSSSNMVELTEGASGGELARVNFSFFLETSKIHGASCLFFDEIDAHVGGVTSTLMGDQLRRLSESKQVFCVTHFPQMALKAHNHLSFLKQQNENETLVSIHYKQNGIIDFEIDRMSGVKG